VIVSFSNLYTSLIFAGGLRVDDLRVE